MTFADGWFTEMSPSVYPQQPSCLLQSIHFKALQKGSVRFETIKIKNENA
jgi:hypothetical protein